MYEDGGGGGERLATVLPAERCYLVIKINLNFGLHPNLASQGFLRPCNQ